MRKNIYLCWDLQYQTWHIYIYTHILTHIQIDRQYFILSYWAPNSHTHTFAQTCSRWQTRHTLLLTKSITKYLRRKLLYISAYLSSVANVRRVCTNTTTYRKQRDIQLNHTLYLVYTSTQKIKSILKINPKIP